MRIIRATEEHFCLIEPINVFENLQTAEKSTERLFLSFPSLHAKDGEVSEMKNSIDHGKESVEEEGGAKITKRREQITVEH